MKSLKNLQPQNWNVELNQTLYNAQITRKNPSALLFMIDQSASMGFEEQLYKGEMKTLAQIVADMVNEMISEVIYRCTKAEGIRDYFNICVLGYGGEDDTGVKVLWEGNLKGKEWVSLSELKANAKYEKREVVKKIRGIEKKSIIDIPSWIQPVVRSITPMCGAFKKAHNLISKWIMENDHKNSFPPIVINITDGMQNDCTDDTLIKSAKKLQALNTQDGHVLVLNCHLADNSDSVIFPLKKEELPIDNYALTLFEMSSVMPGTFNAEIFRVRQDTDVFSGYRGMGFNMSMNALFNMIDIGTTGATKQITGK